MVNWSFSRLSTYSACPKRYELKYIDGHRGEPTLPMLAGTAVHKAIEQWEVRHVNEQPDGPKLKDIARHLLASDPGLPVARVYGKKNVDYWLTTGLERMCDAWLEFRGQQSIVWATVAPPSVEVEVSWRAGGAEFVGYIDQLVVAPDGERLIVRDLKTGKPQASHRVQLELYMASLPDELRRRFDRVSAEAVYLKDDGSYEIQTTEPTLSFDELDAWLRGFTEAQRSGAFPATGRFNGACEWCDVADRCPVATVGERNVLL